MKWAIRILIGIVLFCLPGLVFAGAFYWKFFQPIPEARVELTDDPAAAQQADLEYLLTFPLYDKSFSPEERTQFEADIQTLLASSHTMSETEFALTVSRLVSLSENGHTNISLGDLISSSNALPVRFFWFHEGLYIVRAHHDVSNLVGARVTAYDGQSPDNLIEALDPFYGSNEAFLKFNSSLFLISPELMAGMNLANSPDRVSLDLMMPDGTSQQITLEAENNPDRPSRQSFVVLPPGEEAAENWVGLDMISDQFGLYGQNPETTFWTKRWEDGGAYIRLRQTWSSETQALSPFLSDVRETYQSQPAEYLVLDLRSNTGGDYTQTMSFAKNLTDLVTDDGRIYILVDNGTFSAAIVTAAMALHAGNNNAFLIGAPMGDEAQFWAEGARAMTLPHSQVRIWTATAYHDWENGCTEWSRCYWMNILFGVAAGDLSVDHMAPLRFGDYMAGRDTGIIRIQELESAQ